ncbi:hypothetical protein SUGI_1158690 [Cryptomeria japonica]|nr:hypothetical protein SUGI_1158690 [Cryptomeria japonica]
MVESHIGSLIRDYFDTKLTDGKIRRWKLVSLGNSAMCSQLRNILNSRHIPVSNDDDSIFWCGSKTGEYSVKFGYEAQRIRGMIASWPHKLCWNNRLLPKAGAFLWITLHNRILTADRLKLIGISGPSMCFMCKEVDETSNHLLFSCPVVVSC